MLYWIFDLDYTLYQLPQGVDFDYKHLKNDSQLKYLLSMLPCKKKIFTNGTYNHALVCLDKLGLEENFDQITARDTIKDYKPNITMHANF